MAKALPKAEIVNWLVNDGDALAENQDMVEVMTDKATVTIGSPKAGKVAREALQGRRHGAGR
ncbi:MAG: lipoyl domain-containing protein [Polyangiaceae bacterium]